MANDYHPRSDTRIDTEGVNCSSDCDTGRVADLTGQGMRLIIQNATLPVVGDTKDYTFIDENTGNQLTVRGTVRWIRKGSPIKKRNELGIEFVDLPPSHRDALLHLAVLGQLVITNETNALPGPASPRRVNLYSIFGVSSYASIDEIKSSYHKLVKLWHPDYNKDPEAPTRFEELHKAYFILKDPTLRARYDSHQNTDLQSDQGPDQAAA